MYKNQSILAIIPARGGSKRVPGKNIRDLCGKPLIAWVIEAAQKSKLLDRVILSSDNQKIIATAKKFDCEVPFVRPTHLAKDESKSIDAILHALQNLTVKYDYIVTLQPTSPFVSSLDIDGCIMLAVDRQASACITISEMEKSPYWSFKMAEENLLVPLFDDNFLQDRSQELPPLYIPTGAVYVNNSKWLQSNRTFYSSKTLGYPVPQERSLDIDTELDFSVCEHLMRTYHLHEDVPR